MKQTQIRRQPSRSERERRRARREALLVAPAGSGAPDALDTDTVLAAIDAVLTEAA